MAPAAILGSCVFCRPAALRGRLLHTARTLLYQRRADHPLDYRPTGVPLFDEHLADLFGNPHDPHAAGQVASRKEGALVLESVLLRDLLHRVHNELPTLKKTLSPEPLPPEKDRAGLKKSPMCFEYYDFHVTPTSKYNAPRPPALVSCRVVLHVDMALLALKEPLSKAQMHLLRLLASEHRDAEAEKAIAADTALKAGSGSNDGYTAYDEGSSTGTETESGGVLGALVLPRGYDPLNDSLRIACARYPYRAQNKRWLGDTLARILAHVKSATDCFEDLIPDLTYADAALRRREQARQFLASTYPPEWAVKKPS